jgi:methionine-rich copper-binding protein CopC
MKHFPLATGRKHAVRVLALLFSLMSLGHVHAQPVIVSTSPPNGATGVPLSATLAITFSEVMSNTTTAYLVDSVTYIHLDISPSWSTGNTVLICTPNAPLPANRKILWNVQNGQNLAGAALSGLTGGTFTTISAGPLTLTNALWSGGIFAFDVTSGAGQTLTVEYNSTLRSNQWQTLVTTNSPAGLVHIVDPQSSANPRLFYRARTGS